MTGKHGLTHLRSIEDVTALMIQLDN